MDFTEQRNNLLAKIEDGIPPSVLLLSHVSDLIRDCLKAHLTSDGPMKPTQVQLVFDHTSAAWENARKILDSPKKSLRGSLSCLPNRASGKPFRFRPIALNK